MFSGGGCGVDKVGNRLAFSFSLLSNFQAIKQFDMTVYIGDCKRIDEENYLELIIKINIHLLIFKNGGFIL